MPETTSLHGMMSSVLTGTLTGTLELALTGTLTSLLTMTCDGAADFDWSMIPTFGPWGHHRACAR